MCYSKRFKCSFTLFFFSIILLLRSLFSFFNQRREQKLEKIYQELNEEDTDVKKWNQALIPKAILLFPPTVFVLTFFKINTDKLTIDLIGFIGIGVLLVCGGIFYLKVSNGISS